MHAFRQTVVGERVVLFSSFVKSMSLCRRRLLPKMTLRIAADQVAFTR